jgi:glycosyltransferase involved in cell wall biosynthesis
LQPNFAIENADCATVLGNDFTIGTYRYANKTMHRVPISAPMLYDWPAEKNFEQSRKHFLWLGSTGFVHKGLDLLLEAFAATPEYHLTVCGPLSKEKEFTRAYQEMLYGLPNIHTEGWVDVTSSKFLEIAKRCIALVYPSCSEGGGGSVINCMHAGLIPIVSREASVDVDGFGMVLEDCTIEAIQRAVQALAELPVEQLEARARKAWHYARTHHTREIFTREYRNAVSAILAGTAEEKRSAATAAISRSFAQMSKQPL